MLVITRKTGESFTIGDEVTVTVLGDRERPVRLGIDAPVHVRVLRTELRERERDRPSATSASIGADDSGQRLPATR